MVVVVLVDGLRSKSGNRIEFLIGDGVCACCFSVQLHDANKKMATSTRGVRERSHQAQKCRGVKTLCTDQLQISLVSCCYTDTQQAQTQSQLLYLFSSETCQCAKHCALDFGDLSVLHGVHQCVLSASRVALQLGRRVLLAEGCDHRGILQHLSGTLLLLLFLHFDSLTVNAQECAD